MNVLRLGLAQVASSPGCDDNLLRVRGWLAKLATRCDLALFPENVLCLGGAAAVRGCARSLAKWDAVLGAAAAEFGVAVVFGGVPVARAGAIYNTALVYDAAGKRLARYEKIHLFQIVSTATGPIDETACYRHGRQPIVLPFSGWRIGLSICYDLRFPELYRLYSPADLILCPAAFTDYTGRAHWETLLRARAIENQCYVAGVGQCGTNAETAIPLHGHSMVVDPWGEVVARTEDRTEGVVVAELRHDRVEAVRHLLPALANRRLPPLGRRQAE